MIKSAGIFYENDYFRHAYDMDKTSPENMGKTHGVVLALDIAKRPLKLEMNAERLERASDEEVEAFRKRFADIDPKSLAPLPLQRYDGDIAVRRTVDQLVSSGVDGVTVIVDPVVADDIQAALEGCSGEIEIVDFDAETVGVLEAESDGVQIELLGRGLILWVRDQVVLPENCDSLLFVHADSVGFEPRHYRRMRTTLEEDTSIDFATAWVEWRAGLPLILPLSFIDRLSRPLANRLPLAQGAQQLACLTYRGRHVIMDEDKLFGPYVYIVGAQKPGALPPSALTTIYQARKVPTEYEARVAKAKGTATNPHVKAAKEFLERLDASLASDPIIGLEEANKWAMRNRHDFPLLNTRENASLVYLDAAATSLQPSPVIEAEREFATHYDANIWRGVYANAGFATGKYQAAREKVASFINADPRDVIFTTNTTTSLNLVAQAWAQHNLNEGDLVLVMCNEHHSNMLPWQRAARLTGAILEFIPIEPSGRVDWEAYKALLARKPKLVCAAQTSNVIGLENPIKCMCAEAKKVGATFVVDAAQSSPHLRIDVVDLDIDFLALSGHKVQGPTGIGVLWARPERIREMVPTQIGGGTISEVSYEGTYYRQAPYGFEPGTPPISQAIALGEAIDYLQMIGMDHVEKHVAAMTSYALRVASLIPGIRILGDHKEADGATGLLCYTFDKLESIQVSMLLGSMGVAVRCGAHCAVQLALALGIPGTTRISFGPYTTKADIEAWGYAMSVIADLSRNEVPRS